MANISEEHAQRAAEVMRRHADGQSLSQIAHDDPELAGECAELASHFQAVPDGAARCEMACAHHDPLS